MSKLIIRASSVSQLLTNGRDRKSMGDTAKGLIKSIAIRDLYGLEAQVNTKEMDKGTWLEGDGIELINRVEFKQYEKNTIRITEGGFTGECDIDSEKEDLIRDLKLAWTSNSFSWTKDDLIGYCKKGGYESQLRTYMMLYCRSYAKLDHLLLSTPIDLVPPYEDSDFHDVDHIPEEKRLTTIEFKRDAIWEEKLLERYYEAEKYYNSFVQEIERK